MNVGVIVGVKWLMELLFLDFCSHLSLLYWFVLLELGNANGSFLRLKWS